MGNTELFNQMAEKYDSLERSAVSQIITAQIKAELGELPTGLTLIDYGCGTGEVGLEFVADFETVYFADTAANMLKVVERKLALASVTNSQTVQIQEGQDLGIKADVIVLVQVMLHVSDTQALLESLYRSLKPNGQLIIIDFDKNPLVTSDLVHNGFEETALSQLLSEIGFNVPARQIFYTADSLFMKEKASLFSLVCQK